MCACGAPAADALLLALPWLPIRMDVVESELAYKKLIVLMQRSDEPAEPCESEAFMWSPAVLPLLLTAVAKIVNPALAEGVRVPTQAHLAEELVRDVPASVIMYL